MPWQLMHISTNSCVPHRCRDQGRKAVDRLHESRVPDFDGNVRHVRREYGSRPQRPLQQRPMHSLRCTRVCSMNLTLMAGQVSLQHPPEASAHWLRSPVCGPSMLRLLLAAADLVPRAKPGRYLHAPGPFDDIADAEVAAEAQPRHLC